MEAPLCSGFGSRQSAEAEILSDPVGKRVYIKVMHKWKLLNTN